MITWLSMAALATSLQAEDCQALAQQTVNEGRIVSAEAVAAGPFQAEGPAGMGPPVRTDLELPAHCRVKLHLTPTEESSIHAELWLPLSEWNGRYLAVGNGGWAGTIQGYNDMQEALVRGYATAGSDNGAGGAGPNGRFALGAPERMVDFAYRALHSMSREARQLVSRFYQQPAERAYYVGCSTGGRQGLMAAQRFPTDYDAIIAGAPANRHIHMHVAQSYETILVNREPDGAIPPATAAHVNEAIMAQCDVHGEGFISNPQQCRFDFSQLQCPSGEDHETCLNPAQRDTVERYYGGVKLATGELVFAGRSLSVPLSPMLANDEAPNPFLFDTISILGFQNPDYDWRDFDLNRDLPHIDAQVGYNDATDTDLSAFRDQGGKMILYHGWEDPGITPQNTVDYYEGVLQTMGADQRDWLRLFMVPGMGHCRGGMGPESFDMLSAMEDWRENDQAPDLVPARNEQSGLERNLCPYPEAPVYRGSGELSAASSWECR